MSEPAGESGQLPSLIADPFGVLERRWRWMLAVAALGVLATGAAVLMMPVTYVASVTVLVSHQQISEAFVPDTTGDKGIESVDALVGEVLSRERLGPIVENYSLFESVRGQMTDTEVIQLARNRVLVTPSEPMTPTRRGESSNLYVISFEYEKADVAAGVANDLASLFMGAASRVRGRQTRLTTEFMRAELGRSERELRAQESLVTEFKQEHRGELPSELAPNSSRLERLAIERQSIVTQLASAEARLARLRDLGDLTDPSSPYARLGSLRDRLVSELAVNTEEHPNVVSLKRAIAALEAEVAAGPRNEDPTTGVALRALETEVGDLRARLGRNEREAAGLEARVARTPQAEEQLSAMEQRAGVLRETYVTNLRKVEAAELAQNVESAQQGARVEVLDRALPPSSPVRNRLLIAVGGIAGALAAAIGVALVLELRDPVIVSPRQVEEELGLPVLGSVDQIG